MRALEIGALLALPLFVFFVLGAEQFFLQNGIDPFIYIGYAANSNDLITRYGLPYYAVRFGLLLPAELFATGLGTIPGYFALRYLLAVGSGASVYVLFKRLGSRAVGLTCALFLVASPVFLRAVMTMYSDTSGLPFLTIGLALLVVPAPRHPVLHPLAIGGAFGMALHSNPFTAVVIASALIPWTLLRLGRDTRRSLVRQLALMLAAVVEVTLAGAAIYGFRYGTFNIMAPTLKAISELSGGGLEPFRAPTLGWLKFRLDLYVPWLVGVAWLCVALPGAGLKAVPRHELGAVLALLLTAVAYAYNQFVSRGIALEVYYYSSYLLAPTTIVLGFTFLRLRVRCRTRWAMPMVGLFLAARWWAWPRYLDRIQLWAWPTVPLLTLLLVGIVTVARRREVIAPVAMGVLLCSLVACTLAAPRSVPLAAGQTFRFEPSYYLALDNDSDVGMEWYELSFTFAQSMPTWDQRPGTILFWYRNEPNLLNAVQSTFLWRGQTLQVGNPGLPILSPAQAEHLRARTPLHVVVLGVDKQDLVLGREKILETGVLVTSESTLHYQTGGTQFSALVLTLVPGSCDTDQKGINSIWWVLPPCS